MNTKESREIRLDEFEELHRKMNLYSMQKGYVGFVKDKLELFVMPCEKATAEITKQQVIEAINDLKK